MGGLKNILATLSVFFVGSQLVGCDNQQKGMAVVKLNTEYRCEILYTYELDPGAGGPQNKRINSDHFFINFNGNALKSYYKEPNAPAHIANGSRFISSEREDESGRIFEALWFEKDINILGLSYKHVVNLFREKTKGANNEISYVGTTNTNRRTVYVGTCK